MTQGYQVMYISGCVCDLVHPEPLFILFTPAIYFNLSCSVYMYSIYVCRYLHVRNVSTCFAWSLFPGTTSASNNTCVYSVYPLLGCKATTSSDIFLHVYVLHATA